MGAEVTRIVASTVDETRPPASKDGHTDQVHAERRDDTTVVAETAPVSCLMALPKRCIHVTVSSTTVPKPATWLLLASSCVDLPAYGCWRWRGSRKPAWTPWVCRHVARGSGDCPRQHVSCRLPFVQLHYQHWTGSFRGNRIRDTAQHQALKTRQAAGAHHN